jgi:putative FmdB family regulatory protein
MPIYEYECPVCGVRFETLRAIMRADEPAVCPQGHDGGARVISMIASVARSGDAYGLAPGALDAAHGHVHGPDTHSH